MKKQDDKITTKEKQALRFAKLCLQWKAKDIKIVGGIIELTVRTKGGLAPYQYFNFWDLSQVMNTAAKWIKAKYFDLDISFYDTGAGFAWQVHVAVRHREFDGVFDDLAEGIMEICSDMAQTIGEEDA